MWRCLIVNYTFFHNVIICAAFNWLLAMGGSDSPRVAKALEKCCKSLSAGGGRSLLYPLLHHHQLLFDGETAMQGALQGVSALPRFTLWLHLVFITLTALYTFVFLKFVISIWCLILTNWAMFSHMHFCHRQSIWKSCFFHENVFPIFTIKHVYQFC